jgi:hypothetical protein
MYTLLKKNIKESYYGLKRFYNIKVSPERNIKSIIKDIPFCKDCKNYTNRRCILFGELDIVTGTYEHIHASIVRPVNCGIIPKYFEERNNIYSELFRPLKK